MLGKTDFSLPMGRTFREGFGDGLSTKRECFGDGFGTYQGRGCFNGRKPSLLQVNCIGGEYGTCRNEILEQRIQCLARLSIVES